MGFYETKEILGESFPFPTSLLNRTVVADASYSMQTTDYQVAYTSITTGRTVTLPTASAVTNQHFFIKDESGSASTGKTISIVGTIDGGVNPVAINGAYGKYKFYSNGTAFFTE